MQKSDNNHTARNAHRRVKSSTTLNRKYVKRPSKVQTVDSMVTIRRSPKISRFQKTTPTAIHEATEEQQATEMEQQIAEVEQHPIQVAANEKMKMRTEASTPVMPSRPTAKELKEQAIRKALASAERTTSAEQESQMTKTIGKEKPVKVHFGFGRVLLALSCAAVAVFAIVYFVNLNMPDISLRVAAMQTGIEASYPNYVPRDYNLTDITSEDGKITLNFKNKNTGDIFSLVEEQSSWDSNALLANYVKDAYSESYATVREQGLTIFMDGSNAAWVNGGVVYKLSAKSGALTKKQIRSIAVSL